MKNNNDIRLFLTANDSMENRSNRRNDFKMFNPYMLVIVICRLYTSVQYTVIEEGLN